MAWYLKHETPRRNFDGTTSVYCRQCGREVVKRRDAQIRSITKCAICLLQEQGVKNAEELVLQRYVQLDPTRPPVPRDAEGLDSVFMLFPEEKVEGPIPPSGGIMGTAKALYRALGFGKEPVKVEDLPKSKRAAMRERKSTLYD